MSGNLPLMVRWLTSIGVIPKAAVAQLESAKAPTMQSVLDAGRLAERTYQALDALGRDVVLLARMGQDLRMFGLKYSHMGFAIKGLHGKDWGLVHLLTKDDSSRSGIYSEGLVNFFSDEPFEMACLIQTLPQSVESALLANWQSLAKALHCSSYSLTAHPYSLSTQNCNQWVLETLALAKDPVNVNRSLAQDWAKTQGFEASCLNISLPVQWAGPLLRDSIRFTDQPDATRKLGQVSTVTVDSVLRFLASAPAFAAERSDLQQVEISL